MNANTTRKTWKTSKTARRCTTFPSVWGAILGCTGSGREWRYTIGHFGRRTAEFACPTCRAAADTSDSLRGEAYQANLRALQDAAGVADYRTAEVEIIGGRPVLTGRTSHEAVERAVETWARGEGGTVTAAAAAILAFGRDASSIVARHCSAAQRRELATAYRSARDRAA